MSEKQHKQPRPDRFENGFSRNTVIAGIIMIVVLMPLLAYLNLMTGMEGTMGGWWVALLAPGFPLMFLVLAAFIWKPL